MWGVGFRIVTCLEGCGEVNEAESDRITPDRVLKTAAQYFLYAALSFKLPKESLKVPINVECINSLNIPEEDVEPKQIILDPDDQPMWESAKTVAPTLNSAIVQPNVDDNFVINSTHLNMIRENKFDGYLQADPHDHIREFLAICNMFKYGETQSEDVKLLIFPYSLSDKAKTWFNELNEESITSWEQMRKAFINRFFPPSFMLRKSHGHGLTKGAIIQIFYHGLDEPTQGILDVTAGGIFFYKTPNQAFQFLEDKAMDSQIISLNEELQDIRNKYNELREGNTSKNHLNDDTPMCERHEVNFIQSEGYQNRNSQDSYSPQSHHNPNDSEKSVTEIKNNVRNDLEDFKRRIRSMRTVHDKLFTRDNKESKIVNQESQSKTDFKKSITKFLDGQRVTNMFFKNNVNDMVLKMKQNEKNFQTKIKNMERKMDEWSKSQNVSSEQTDRTEPRPPPQAQTEQVNTVFTRSGKSDDSPKTQKDSPPPIIVNNNIKKDKPIKTSKKGYHMVKTK
ncbi:reverse transcriptase domain-containing protein [Tanacetum coccineum]